MKNVARAQIMFLCVFLLSTCGLYLFRHREDDDFRVETKDNIKEGEVYSRDHLGYFYPKEYFQFVSADHKGNLFNNVSLKGRHSDTVLSACQDPAGNFPNVVKEDYKMTGQYDYLDNYKNPCWFEQGDQSNKTLQCIPYYYFIGTPKAGSSDLYWRMEMHPQMAPNFIKEHRFFDTSRFSDKEKTYIEYYVDKFRRSARFIQHATIDREYHHKIVGDGSPSYLFNNINWPLFPGNEWCLEPRVMTVSYIHNLFPSAKLILIVRNPVDRLYSDYLFNSKRTRANRTAEEFHVWAKTTVDIYKDCFKNHPFRQCLYSRSIRYQTMVHSFTASIYSRLILDVLRIFPRDQLLILQMEDYSANMADRLRDVFDFLGLDRLTDERMKEITEVKQINPGKFYKKSGPMLPVTRRMLYNFYKPFNEELAYILNDDKYLWPEE